MKQTTINPIEELIIWLQNEGFETKEQSIDAPFVLSTCSKNAMPSSRVLFLKQIINEKLI